MTGLVQVCNWIALPYLLDDVPYLNDGQVDVVILLPLLPQLLVTGEIYSIQPPPY